MSGFSIRNPFFIIVACLVVAIVGVVTLARMPVDLFPPINIPVVVVATFYSGMPPQQIETNITNPFERWFTLASGIDHIESRSIATTRHATMIKNGFRMENPDISVHFLFLPRCRSRLSAEFFLHYGIRCDFR
jgi:multidrug efflux pump subunit AcrB